MWGGGWVDGLVCVCMGFESVGYSDRRGAGVVVGWRWGVEGMTNELHKRYFVRVQVNESIVV